MIYPDSPVFSRAQFDEVARLHQTTGLTSTQIADRVGMSRSTVMRFIWRNRMGRGTGVVRRPERDLSIDKARQLREAGRSTQQIARALGVSQRTVFRYLFLTDEG